MPDNSNTHQSFEPRPPEPFATQLARANRKNKCAIELMYACAHSTGFDEELNWLDFHMVIIFSKALEDFVALKNLQFFTHNKCLLSSKPWSLKNLRWFCFYDIILLSFSESRTLQLIKQLHDIVYKTTLRIALTKFSFQATHCKLYWSRNWFQHN